MGCLKILWLKGKNTVRGRTAPSPHGWKGGIRNESNKRCVGRRKKGGRVIKVNSKDNILAKLCVCRFCKLPKSAISCLDFFLVCNIISLQPGKVYNVLRIVKMKIETLSYQAAPTKAPLYPFFNRFFTFNLYVSKQSVILLASSIILSL